VPVSCKTSNGRQVGREYHITKVPPLVQEVPVDIDTVRLGEVFGDQLPDSRQIDLLLGSLVLHITQFIAHGDRMQRRAQRTELSMYTIRYLDTLVAGGGASMSTWSLPSSLPSDLRLGARAL
jgi:hypothetical protein